MLWIQQLPSCLSPSLPCRVRLAGRVSGESETGITKFLLKNLLISLLENEEHQQRAYTYTVYVQYRMFSFNVIDPPNIIRLVRVETVTLKCTFSYSSRRIPCFLHSLYISLQGKYIALYRDQSVVIHTEHKRKCLLFKLSKKSIETV